ncbi:MAG: trans-2-enoyl-CoA reductase family protein [Verrucomicrobiales bacterium]|nr:trans-2-enoyl-CoA reductase family protein [Verrucomicrobiales bacterium]
MIIKPKTRGFICTTAHPDGCKEHVRSQIEYVQGEGNLEKSGKNVLVIGASTGYGLASRIVPAFGGNCPTIGVFFEKPGTENRTGSAGWYNSVAFEEFAAQKGLYAKSFNGDAFSHELKKEVIDTIKNDWGHVDMIVYSLASPRRTDPDTGEVYKSVLKPIGAPYSQKNLNTDTGEVTSVSIEAAEGDDILNTEKVMGGEDWEMWINDLNEAGLLADGFTTVAYSYIGPELTFPIYTNGTIGKAKEHVEKTAAAINGKFGEGSAYVSVNKALVTQASSAIPVVPLYISLLYKVMKENGTHEGCIEQIYRLFSDHLYHTGSPKLDEKGRIRIDDLEMAGEVQSAVMDAWQKVDTDNLTEISDFEGYRSEFLKLFGFGLNGVDYTQETNPVREMPSAT